MRGKIYNRERAQQLRDFSGLRFGNITPTDIDGYVEFNDTLFIWIEGKSRGNDLPYGQKLALTRMCQIIHGTTNHWGKVRTAVVIVVEYDTPADQDIDYAQAGVACVFYDGKWIEPSQPVTLRQEIENLLKQHTQLRYTKAQQ